MDLALFGVRMVLAAVFVVAGVAKLLDRPGSAQALTNFGVSPQLARPFSVLLPLTELTIAFALLPVRTAWWAGLGALILLLLFNAAIGLNLVRGRAPECHCFGQLHSEPVGWSTLARNGV